MTTSYLLEFFHIEREDEIGLIRPIIEKNITDGLHEVLTLQIMFSTDHSAKFRIISVGKDIALYKMLNNFGTIVGVVNEEPGFVSLRQGLEDAP